MYGIAPWNSAGRFDLVDPKARWVWASANAQDGAPGGNVTFQTTYINNNSSPVEALLYVVIDDSVYITLNGAVIGSVTNDHWDQKADALPVELLPGANTFLFNAYNQGTGSSAAGLIYSLVESNTSQVLTHSGPGLDLSESSLGELDVAKI